MFTKTMFVAARLPLWVGRKVGRGEEGVFLRQKIAPDKDKSMELVFWVLDF